MSDLKDNRKELHEVKIITYRGKSISQVRWSLLLRRTE